MRRTLREARPAWCQRCKANEAEWAWQPDLDQDTFYALGWHERGFKVIKVCEACRVSLKVKPVHKRAEQRAASDEYARIMGDHYGED